MMQQIMHTYSKLLFYLLPVALLSFLSPEAMAQFPAPYCTANFNAAVEPISLVSFSNISRTSPPGTSGAVSLEDFTSDTATVTIGQSYTITVEGNTDGGVADNFKVFFDWNQNYIFADSSGEMFDIGDISASTGADGKQASVSIPIPVYARTGYTRMRVVKKYGSSASNTSPCPTNGWGQAEDYTLHVVASAVCLPPPGLAPTANTGTSVTFGWTGVSGAAGYEYAVDQSSASPAGAGTAVTGTTATASITPTGTYYLHVRTDCGSGSFSSWTTAPAAMPFPYPYCNITALTGGPITSVQFAGINRTSPAAIGAPALEDFLTDTGKIIPGLPYIITLKGNTNGNWVSHFRVFIDWDQDNVFGSGESYDARTVYNSTGTDATYTDDTIEAPLNAKLGITRMRIVKKQGSALTNTTACPTNGDGQAEDYTILVMKSPVCLMPRGLKIDNISGVSVAFSWSAMHGVNGYEYIVNTTRTAPTVAGTSTTTTNGNNITPLAGNTLYYIHVRSDCGGGDFSGWALDSFITCTPPSGLDTADVTHYSATLSWNAISGVSGYEYVVDQSATDPAGPGTATTATSVTDSTLSTNQTYYLHVRTHCGGGVYSIWTTLSFKTPWVSCFIVDIVTANDILSTSATLEWYLFSGSKKGYEYVLDQVATDPTGAGIPTKDTFFNATGLQPNTKYYIHARTDCYGGLFSFWRTHEFTTLPICYTLPTGLIATDITPSSAILHWDKINGVSGYQYVIDQVSTDPTVAGIFTTDTFVNKAGLTAGAVYYLHVRTDCGSGDYSYWKTYAFTVCASPLGLTATNIKETEATVSWTAVSGAKEYEYLVDQWSISPIGGAPTIVTTNVSEIVTGLFSGTQYYLHVRTNCDKGNSVWELYPFTTQLPESVVGAAKQLNSFSTYPNPVNGVLNYNITGTIGKDETIQVMDITGRVVLSADVTATKGSIDMSNLAGGIYLIRYVTLTGSSFTTIAKQ